MKQLIEEGWGQRYGRAYQYGHNVLRLKSWELSRYAHAYADITEAEEWTNRAFGRLWLAGEFEPDSIGHYHHKSWFAQQATKSRIAV